MRRLLALLLLLPISALAQDDCEHDGFTYPGLLLAAHPQLLSSYPAGVPDGDTWADTSGLHPPGTMGLLVQVRDPGDPDDPNLPSDPDLGCAPLSNADEVAGNIALMERGGCKFGQKALHAQDAGAIGFIIRNDSLHGVILDALPRYPLYMNGGTYGAQVSIPGLIISYWDGVHLSDVVESHIVDATLRYCSPGSVEVEAPSDARRPRVSAAYPNPFSIQTQFNLTLGRTQHVTAAVYDAVGRRTAVLYSGILAAGSSHEISLEAQALAPGVYFARFTGETFDETRHVVLTR